MFCVIYWIPHQPLQELGIYTHTCMGFACSHPWIREANGATVGRSLVFLIVNELLCLGAVALGVGQLCSSSTFCDLLFSIFEVYIPANNVAGGTILAWCRWFSVTLTYFIVPFVASPFRSLEGILLENLYIISLEQSFATAGTVTTRNTSKHSRTVSLQVVLHGWVSCCIYSHSILCSTTCTQTKPPCVTAVDQLLVHYTSSIYNHNLFRPLSLR
jgi:hypothetical protein